jgi:hypothetical protein
VNDLRLSDQLYASGCSWAPPRTAPTDAKRYFVARVREYFGGDVSRVLLESLGDPPPPWSEAVVAETSTRRGRRAAAQRARRAANRAAQGLCGCAGWCDHRRAKGRAKQRKNARKGGWRQWGVGWPYRGNA